MYDESLIVVLEKKDKTGLVGISVPRIESFEEVKGANTDSQYTIVTLMDGKTYNVQDTFKTIMDVMKFVHAKHFEDNPETII